MEVEEKTLPAVVTTDENNLKKGKILTLLFPAELQQGEGKEVKTDKNKPPTKVVIRRLPPKLTKETFLEEFAPLPPHDYFYFVRGDLNQGPHAFSRAYVNFLNQEDIFAFKEKFDDYDIQDDKGKTYHAVVEFAPFQKIPRRTVVKKKLSKSGTLESDPKYMEFLQKLEESKNFINNPSEYFHETESSALKTKIVMTPLLEYLKKKRQKKIDLKNEIRQRKREAEREKKRKDEEKKRIDREKRKEEKKSLDRNKGFDEKPKKLEVKDKKGDDGRIKEYKKNSKSQENLKIEPAEKEQMDPVIPNDPAILEIVSFENAFGNRKMNLMNPLQVLRHSPSEKHSKTGSKPICNSNEETKCLKNNESETNLGKPERKFSDFRTRLVEEKQRKAFYKRDLEELKTMKTNQGNRKGVPDEKGDSYSIGSGSEVKDVGKKLLSDMETKRQDYRIETRETKSKFRYSEQRNRDREFRLKTSDCKITKDNQGISVELKNKVNSDEKGTVKKGNEEESKILETKTKREIKASSNTDQITLPSRRKSLEMEREVVDAERKRSKSFPDISSKELCRLQEENMNDKYRSEKDRDANTPENDCGQTDDNSKESTESKRMTEESKKDRKAERRIRNKDRPSLEIYRPGMGKFSKQRLEQKRDDRNNSTSTSYENKVSSFVNKSNKKQGIKNDLGENKSTSKNEGNETSGKAQSEVRTMMFTRSTGKEN